MPNGTLKDATLLLIIESVRGANITKTECVRGLKMIEEEVKQEGPDYSGVCDGIKNNLFCLGLKDRTRGPCKWYDNSERGFDSEHSYCRLFKKELK